MLLGEQPYYDNFTLTRSYYSSFTSMLNVNRVSHRYNGIENYPMKFDMNNERLFTYLSMHIINFILFCSESHLGYNLYYKSIALGGALGSLCKAIIT